MDPFEEPYWSQLQAVLWVNKRLKGMVRLAADRRRPPRDLDDEQGDPPGYESDAALIADVVMPGGRIGRRWRSCLRPDCSFQGAEEELRDALAGGRVRALGRRNGEGDRERIPPEQWVDLQFYWAHPLRESRRHLPHSVNNSGRYVGPRDQLQRNVAYWTNVLFKREEVLALWPDLVLETLRAKTERLTLAEAVALLVRGRPGSREAWRRLRRRYGGCFPAATRQQIKEAGQEIVEMLRRREITASGRPCVRDGGRPTGGMECLDEDFLDEPLWVDPCADEIWTEFSLGDGLFNPVDRGYRYVVLKRQQFSEAIKAQGSLPQPDRASYKDVAPDRAYDAVERSSALQQQARRGISGAKLRSWYRDAWIKYNEREGKIPSRDDDWAAARLQVSPNVPREAVRRLRRELAPHSWTKPGRRKKIGGN